MRVLGQQSPNADPVAVVVLVAVLIVVVVGAGLAIMHMRGRMLRAQDDRSATESWLDELRAMHRRGEVSDEEFQAARASLLAKVTGQAVRRAGATADRSVRVAPPGFDLTGAPLPKTGGPIQESPREEAGGSEGSSPPAA